MTAAVADLRVWQRIRRYAVPAAMIEACTAYRLAGDWRAACAAGDIEVAFDPARLADAYGAEAARTIGRDLAGLAPDLLRWYLPRLSDGRTALATYDRYVLSTTTGRLGSDDPSLIVEMPRTVDGSQRLRLIVDLRNSATSLGTRDLPPAVWHAGHAAGIRALYCGPDDRLPGFARDGTRLDADDPPTDQDAVIAAWRAAGIELDPTPPTDPYRQGPTPLAGLIGRRLPLAGLAAEARRVATRYGTRIVRSALPYPRAPTSIDVSDPARLLAWSARDRSTYDAPEMYLPPPDPDLVWHGLIEPDELHPLVVRALFPDRPTAPSRAGALPPADLALAPVRVRCRGAWHTLIHDGGLGMPAHPPEEIQRERMMHSLGGPVTGCFAVARSWTNGRGRLPKTLTAQRRDILHRIQHGGAPALLDLLDAGLDPHVRDARGWSLLHHLRELDHTLVLPRLLAAGLPVDTRDHFGRTPLHVAVCDVGTPELVLALLRAGADPEATDERGNSVVDLAAYKSGHFDDEDDDETDPHSPLDRIYRYVTGRFDEADD